jgi:hypothetical protein
MALDASSAAFSQIETAGFIEPSGRRGASCPPDEISVIHLRPKLRIVPEEDSSSRSTVAKFGVDDPVRELIAIEAARLFGQQLINEQMQNRVRELHIDALRSQDPFSEASFNDLKQLIGTVRLTRRPSIFLLDNGNLRALWKNDANEQVGLQFLGRGAVQFVMFAKRPTFMMRESGVDELSAIADRLRANGCDRLL